MFFREESNEIEIWKPVPIKEYENLYKVSNLGNIYSCNRQKILKPELSYNWYLKVKLHSKLKQTHNLHFEFVNKIE